MSKARVGKRLYDRELAEIQRRVQVYDDAYAVLMNVDAPGKDRRTADDTRQGIAAIADVRVLLEHVAYLEYELSKQRG